MKLYEKPAVSFLTTSVFESIAANCWAGGTFVVNAFFPKSQPWQPDVVINKTVNTPTVNWTCTATYHGWPVITSLYNQVQSEVGYNPNHHNWWQALNSPSRFNVVDQYITFGNGS